MTMTTAEWVTHIDAERERRSQGGAGAVSYATITPCDYALRDVIYVTCPREVHDFDGPRCADCPLTVERQFDGKTAATYRPPHGGYPTPRFYMEADEAITMMRGYWQHALGEPGPGAHIYVVEQEG